ncbi:MAG: ATP-dependent RNA helicase RhlE [Limisphaerales bacterium]|jgi:ATP-dependent RNA helicase RhlE
MKDQSIASREQRGDAQPEHSALGNSSEASTNSSDSNLDTLIDPNAPKLASEGVFGKLIPQLQQAIASEGYTTPTPIQEQCIPLLLEGKDLLGSAQTGTGKTAAFTLPLLDHLSFFKGKPDPGYPSALILAPTRELAAQIGDSIHAYGRNLRIRHTVVFGGVSQGPQVKALNRGVDILVATPGRLLDLMQQGHINLADIEFFILDEVDRMLDMGFIHDIKRILEKIPEDRQTLFFSATMPPKMVELAATMVKNPERVTIEPNKPTVEKINQKVLFVNKKDKNDLLINLLRDSDFKKAIVFTQMKHMANRVVEKLEAVGIRAAAIHGNKSQAARTSALDGFKRGRVRVLVATDVASRGIDVEGITHVFNYDLPVEAETYVHRIGRTARAGSDGDAISFCASDERAYLTEIEKLLGTSIPADLEHDLHDERARVSDLPIPPRPEKFKGKRGGRSGDSRGGGSRGASSRSGGSGRSSSSRSSSSGGSSGKSSRPGSGNWRSKR